ncbi:MAG: hypothetical protein WAW75_05950 [Gallionella sp.]
MDQLLAKLTNLSFDFFSILLPGIIINIFALLLWIAVGSPVPLTWANSGISESTIPALLHLVDILSLKGNINPVIPLVFLWYFLGHWLNWFGILNLEFQNQNKITQFTRTIQSLIFRIPKLPSPFDREFESLYKGIQKHFSTTDIKLEGDSLSFVVKNYLAQNLSRSQVTYYQNKYVLHRSITIASTFLFWLSILGGLVVTYCYGRQPHWLFLFLLSIGSFVSVWAFSGSYLNNLDLYHKTIVTEAYSLLHDHKGDSKWTD